MNFRLLLVNRHHCPARRLKPRARVYLYTRPRAASRTAFFYADITRVTLPAVAGIKKMNFSDGTSLSRSPLSEILGNRRIATRDTVNIVAAERNRGTSAWFLGFPRRWILTLTVENCKLFKKKNGFSAGFREFRGYSIL